MTRVPLPPGTILRFPSGRGCQICALLGGGGSALLYEAKELDSQLYLAVKEVYPAWGFVRQNGAILPQPDTPGSAASLAALKQRLHTQEAALSQRASRNNFQVLHLHAPVYCQADILLPDGTCYQGVPNCYGLMDSLKGKGMTLRAYVESCRTQGLPLSLRTVLAIFETVLEAYAALHGDGFLHGDCQPDNLFLLGARPREGIGGTACIIDFGSARELTDGSRTDVITDDIFSTDGYRAPEVQYHDLPFRMTPACDVWSLGFLLLGLLTGRLDGWNELDGQGLTDFLMSHPREKQLSSRQAQQLGCSPAVAHSLNALLKKALANQPESRFPSAREMLHELKHLLGIMALELSQGLDHSLLWEAAHRFCRNNPALFPTRHCPHLVRSLPVEQLELYGRLDQGGDAPMAALLTRFAAASQGGHGYLWAPGGSGKSFAVARLVLEQMDSGAPVPLYLDLAQFTSQALEHAGSYDQVLLHLLCGQYFHQSSPQLRAQLRDLLEAPSPQPRYLLVLDGLHKVAPGVRTAVEAAINQACTLWKSTRLLVCGRAPLAESSSAREGDAASGLAQVLAHRLELLPLSSAAIAQAIQPLRQELLLKPELDAIAHQQAALGLPLLLMRYLEMLSAKGSAEPLPDNLTQLLCRYFGQLALRSSSPVTLQVLTCQLPWLAYCSMQAGWDRFSPADVMTSMELLQQDFRSEDILPLLRRCQDDLAVLVPCEDGCWRFLHDCYQEYFAAFYIGAAIGEALSRRDAAPLKHLCCSWPKAALPHLAELAGGHYTEEGWVRRCTFSQWQEALYAFLSGQNGKGPLHLSAIAVNIPDLPSGGNCDSLEEIKAQYDHWLQLGSRMGDPLCTLLRMVLSLLVNFSGIMRQQNFTPRFWKIYSLMTAGSKEHQAEAYYGLGQLYWQGDGVPQDQEKAVRFFRKAAKLDSAPAQCVLAQACFHGKGTAEDKEQAIHWAQLAARQGYAEAQNDLACYYSLGQGVEKDLTQTCLWSRRAAEQGFAGAQRNLAFCLKEGLGCHADPAEAALWFLRAAQQGLPECQYQYAMACLQGSGVKKDIPLAVRWLQLAAQQQYANAQYELGLLYSQGTGVEKDPVQAVHWISLAARQGLASAQNHLGYCYCLGLGVKQDYDQAFQWCQKACEQGLAAAQCSMARCLENGYGTPVDLPDAVRWYSKAAQQGDAEARNSLGDCYYHGRGVTQDYQKAFHWYHQAAGQNHMDAQHNLARCYYLGHGAEQDYSQSCFWSRKAAEQGLAAAQYDLAYYLEHGMGTPPDLEEALWWYRKSAEQNLPQAQNRLGECFYYGRGVQQDHTQAVFWFRKGAEQGLATAQYNLAHCLQRGLGISASPEEAVHWYRKAVQGEHNPAKVALALCLCRGQGCEQNHREAMELLRSARQNGTPDASNMLGWMYCHGYGLEQPDHTLARTYFEEAAAAGMGVAFYNLGELYRQGLGGETDLSRARTCYEQALALGYTKAQKKLDALDAL